MQKLRNPSHIRTCLKISFLRRKGTILEKITDKHLEEEFPCSSSTPFLWMNIRRMLIFCSDFIGIILWIWTK